jgi:putative transcriptional regulator
MKRRRESIALKNNIANIRKAIGISQKELAEMAGISPNWMNHIECGRRNPSLVAAKNIAQALNVSMKDIFLD